MRTRGRHVLTPNPNPNPNPNPGPSPNPNPSPNPHPDQVVLAKANSFTRWDGVIVGEENLVREEVLTRTPNP